VTNHVPDNAEELIGAALSVPMNIVNSLADLLISKEIISRQEVVSILRRLIDVSPTYGQHEAMVRMMLEGALTRFEGHMDLGSNH